MSKTTKPRSLAELIALFPGTKAELARRIGVTRMILWKIENGQHAACPFELLARLRSELRKPADGSAAPTVPELIAAWRAQQ